MHEAPLYHFEPNIWGTITQSVRLVLCPFSYPLLLLHTSEVEKVLRWPLCGLAFSLSPTPAVPVLITAFHPKKALALAPSSATCEPKTLNVKCAIRYKET